jgi:predicted nuclease of predicted toxin-antitoxin system
LNILADESVDGPIVKRLRQEGHTVQYIAEMTPGITDDMVLELANQEAALLLTADKDFGELVFRQRRVSF